MLNSEEVISDDQSYEDEALKEEIINYDEEQVEGDQSCISYSLEIEKSENSLVNQNRDQQNNYSQSIKQSQSFDSEQNSLDKKLQDTGRLKKGNEIMEVVLKKNQNILYQDHEDQQIVAEAVDIKLQEPLNSKSYQQVFSEFKLKSDKEFLGDQNENSKSFENLESVFKVNSQNMTQEEKEFMNYVHQQKMISAIEMENTQNNLATNQNLFKQNTDNTASFKYQDNRTSLKKFDNDESNDIFKDDYNKKSYNLESINELLKKKNELVNIKKDFCDFQKLGLDEEEQNQFRKTINELDEELVNVEKKIKTLQSIEHGKQNQEVLQQQQNKNQNNKQNNENLNELPEVFLNFKDLKKTSLENLKDLQIPKQKPQEIFIKPKKNSRRITFSATPQEQQKLKKTHDEKFVQLHDKTEKDLLSSERFGSKRTSLKENQDKPPQQKKVKRLKKRRDFQKYKKPSKQDQVNKNTYDEYYKEDSVKELQCNKKLRAKKLKQKSVPNKPLFSSNYLHNLSSQKNKKAFDVLTKNYSSSLQKKQNKNFSIKQIFTKKRQKLSIKKKLFPLVKGDTKSNISSRANSKKVYSQKPKRKKMSLSKRLLPLQTSQKITQKRKHQSRQKTQKKNKSLQKNKLKYQIPKFDNFKFKTQTIYKRTPNKFSIENKTKFSKFINKNKVPVQTNLQIDRIHKKLQLWDKEKDEINSLIKEFENIKF